MSRSSDVGEHRLGLLIIVIIVIFIIVVIFVVVALLAVRNISKWQVHTVKAVGSAG
jgi:hypothetical protein